MSTEEFDYYLPEELIAQTPLKDRSSSRLMTLNRETGEISNKHFTNIIDYLRKGDVLVINDTKVIPARLIGEKVDTKATIELLLLKDLGNNTWECLSRPFKRLHVGDKDRYQTVYAKNLGSAAAPTAGLHFTKELLEKIKEKGIIVTNVTLHVGLGTFRPVEVEDVTKHHMHSEYYEMSKETADILNQAKKEGRRIIAVGTTSTRTLETIMSLYGKFKECHGNTEIFIYPGFEFKAIDCLITNFHLPKSTLVMLVSAFSKKEYILHAYEEAVKEKYRFFSFGDAMFLYKD